MLLHVFLFYLMIDISSSTNVQRIYTTGYGDVLFVDPAAFTGSIVTESLIQCAVFCTSMEENCSLAYYTFSQKVCQLHVSNNVYKLAVNRDPSVTMDTMLLVPMGHHVTLLHTSYVGGDYNVPYPEAEDLCRRIGGHLATEAELGESRTQIPNLCSCGWTQGGIAMYWLTSITDGCCCLKEECGYAYRADFNAHCIVV